MDSEISHYFDIREFVSRETWEKYGTLSFYYVQHRIINICKLLHHKTAETYNVSEEDVSLRINNWHLEEEGEVFEYEGYISGVDNEKLWKDGKLSEEDFDSFHRQGHAANVRISVIKNDKTVQLSAYDIASIILKDEDDFVLNGLTVISEPIKSRDFLHLDCRNTQSFKLKILA